jgi:hypothetical protein
VFALIGLGTQEILLLAIVGAVLVGVPLIVILVVTRMSGNRSGREVAPNEEYRRHRADPAGDRPPPP